MGAECAEGDGGRAVEAADGPERWCHIQLKIGVVRSALLLRGVVGGGGGGGGAEMVAESSEVR